MAENAVVKEQLTGAMIDAGAELTTKLDEIGLPVTAAFWLFVPEVNEWRLMVASPEVSTKGPRDVYEKIRQAIGQLGARAAAVPLSVVGLLDAESRPCPPPEAGNPHWPWSQPCPLLEECDQWSLY